MCITEYDEAKTMEQFREEGREEGIAEGIAKGKAEGIAEGKAKGKVEDLINIVRSFNVSLDKAMDVLGIAANEREKYAALVRSAIQS